MEKLKINPDGAIEKLKKIVSTKTLSVRSETINVLEIVPGYIGGQLIFYQGSMEDGDIRFKVVICFIENQNSIVFFECKTYTENGARNKNQNTIMELIHNRNLYTTNTAKYDTLQSRFKAIFEREFIVSNFFDTGLYSEASCFAGGRSLQELELMNSYVKNNYLDGIQNWLRSSNTYKQVYGVYAIGQLRKISLDVTEQDLILANYIANKAGELNTCIGCDFEVVSIKEICRNFNLK
jgi:hypothetical protein